MQKQGCCNGKLLSCRDTVMRRRNHARCHCHSWVLSCRIAPPNRTRGGEWTADIWEREVLVARQYPGPNLCIFPNKASKALVASGSGTSNWIPQAQEPATRYLRLRNQQLGTSGSGTSNSVPQAQEPATLYLRLRNQQLGTSGSGTSNSVPQAQEPATRYTSGLGTSN